MKSPNWIFVAALGFAIGANAQQAADRNATTTTSSDQIPPVQPPPNLDDKDPVTNVPTPQAVAKTVVDQSAGKPATADTDAQTRAAATSPGLPPEVQAAAEASELPTITVRQSGGDTVEEYRKKGKLYFVRVLSSSGPTKLYVDSPNDIPHDVMQQLSGPSGQVQPVYYKLLDWK
jgi:hypothetical protein